MSQRRAKGAARVVLDGQIKQRDFKVGVDSLAERIMREIIGAGDYEILSTLTALEICARSVRSQADIALLMQPAEAKEKFEKDLAEHFSRLAYINEGAS